MLLNFARSISKDIRFNKVLLPDEIMVGTVNSMAQDPKGYIYGAILLAGALHPDKSNEKIKLNII